MKLKEFFEIQSKFENIKVIIQKIETLFQENKFCDRSKNELVFAVIEAYNNCVEHGYNGNQNELVEVQIEIDEEYFIISLKDHGKGFAFSEIREYNPENSSDLFGSRGRGLFMMNNLVDFFEYIPCEKGTHLKLIKKISYSK